MTLFQYCVPVRLVTVKGYSHKVQLTPYHRVASTQEFVTKNTSETIIYRRHATQKVMFKNFGGFFSLKTKLKSVSERYLAVAYFREYENNSQEIAKQIDFLQLVHK